jgi:hypothetical protein
MKDGDSNAKRGVPLAGEYLDRVNAKQRNLSAIKYWRTKEFEAGRPSGLEDYYRAHGYCLHCRGTGIAVDEHGVLRAIGWDGSRQLYEKCEVCDGTGQISSGAQLQ